MNTETYRDISLVQRGSVVDVPALNYQFPNAFYARRAIDIALRSLQAEDEQHDSEDNLS